jgi:hypothetical protein
MQGENSIHKTERRVRMNGLPNGSEANKKLHAGKESEVTQSD